MSRGEVDQVVISARMTTADARLLLRILLFELGKAKALYPDMSKDDAAARERLVDHVREALRKAGRTDVTHQALVESVRLA